MHEDFSKLSEQQLIGVLHDSPIATPVCNGPRSLPATLSNSDRSSSHGLSLICGRCSERPGAVKGAPLLRGEANP